MSMTNTDARKRHLEKLAELADAVEETGSVEVAADGIRALMDEIPAQEDTCDCNMYDWQHPLSMHEPEKARVEEEDEQPEERKHSSFIRLAKEWEEIASRPGGAYETCARELRAVVAASEQVPGSPWAADLPCPDCGNKMIFGYTLNDASGAHMHTRYVCTFWPSGGKQRCGWTGWSVPGWDAE